MDLTESDAMEERNDLENLQTESSSTPADDGSLLHLYESRLRRLRNYEAAVYPKYSSKEKPTEDEILQNSRLKGPQSGVEGLGRPPLGAPAAVTAPIGPRRPEDPPSVINVNSDDIPDDITVSTGFNSEITPATAEFSQKNTRTKPTSLDVPLGLNETPQESVENDVDSNDDSDQEICHVGKNSSKDDGESAPLSAADDFSVAESNNSSESAEKYTFSAASDSKFETYPNLVDPDQDDRAVEIVLYTGKRPHMRAFHYAWLGFFVAFFNWFGITPLLSEVAHSLNLSREQIWTSNACALASSAITRVVAGPLNDIYGSRLVMCITLSIAALPAIFSGLIIRGSVGLYIIRFLVGVGGSAFVTCQYWTCSMFTVEVAGTALSLVAGWGNLGGGVSQVVMGSILFPIFKLLYGGEAYGKADAVYPEDGELQYDKASDLAWRTILLFPGLMCAYVAYVCIRYADDTPKGNYAKRKKLGMITVESPMTALARGAYNRNTWLMYAQYSCCFGVELTMTSAAALYFQEEFDQPTASAAAIASVFGWMNLFARGLGGFVSDMACAKYGLRGRLWVQLCCLFGEGFFVCLFSITDSLAGAIVSMAVFSIFVQAAEGSTFGIVPYIDYAVTGSITGIVGAGGNFGGVIFSLVFRSYGNRTALRFMGYVILFSSILSAFLRIPGHRTLLFGKDAREVEERRTNHADQVGSVPNIDFHTHTHEGHRNRQSLLRAHPQEGGTEDTTTDKSTEREKTA